MQNRFARLRTSARRTCFHPPRTGPAKCAERGKHPGSIARRLCGTTPSHTLRKILFYLVNVGIWQTAKQHAQADSPLKTISGSAYANPLCIHGAPGRIRTCDLRIRSPLLYPAELRAPRRSAARWYYTAIRGRRRPLAHRNPQRVFPFFSFRDKCVRDKKFFIIYHFFQINQSLTKYRKARKTGTEP